ncbi:MAG TPA: AraC family transcriptional regulator [Steroidobacteraceae bacterium]|nr:AraC family transcriptional regulator [Steroidobacteraceae bacterium]
MNADAALQYQHRLRSVIDHIDAHLNDALSVDELSSIAAFSKFHFHRQFSDFFGINVSKFIQLLRINRATQQLAFRTDPITDIALGSGYESVEAFSRAFKKLTGQTPSDFRKQPDWSTWFSAYQPARELRVNHMVTDDQRHVNIVTTKDINVAALEHRGDPATLGESIRKFIEWRKQHRLHPSKHATFNIFYDDPDAVEPHQYRLDLCVATETAGSKDAVGVINRIIPGGRCAVMRHTGSDDLLRTSISYLYSTWLPASGEELRDFPLYVQRVKFFPDVAEHEAIVDIFLPLK